MKKRVAFFSNNDLSVGHYFDRLFVVLENLYNDTNNINDILEYYNILCFIEDDNILAALKKQKKLDYVELRRKMKIRISIFFKNIIDSNIIELCFQIENFHFKNSFTNLFSNYKLYERISTSVFSEILNHKIFVLENFLYHKMIVEIYEIEIRKKILENEKYTELVIRKYDLKTKRKIFLPAIEADKMNELFYRYINGTPNLNFLKIIYESKKLSFIEDRTRFSAFKKYNELCKSLTSTNQAPSYSIRIETTADMDKISNYIDTENELDIHFQYSKKWIEVYNDELLLLNNFILLFEFLDSNGRMSFYLKKAYKSSFEAIGMKSIDNYLSNLSEVFHMFQLFMKMCTLSYCTVLKSFDIEIENVLNSFFSIYLEKEFSIPNFDFFLTNKEESFKERNWKIFVEIDKMLRQINSYAKYGEIENEMIYLFSNSLLPEQVQSLSKIKNIYINKFSHVYFAFFDSQASFFLGIDPDFKFSTFFETIINCDILYENINNTEKSDIDYLIEESFIYVDDNGMLRFTELRKILLLKNIYENEFLIYWRCSNIERKIIDELIIEGILCSDNKLFSKQEADYFNYFLNDKFTDGLKLRNKYAHNGSSSYLDDEKIFEADYFLILSILIQMILKINDDLCIYFDNEKKSEVID